jgi:hypothetical protein
MDKELLTSTVRAVFLAGLAIESAQTTNIGIQQVKACATCDYHYSQGVLTGVSCTGGSYWLCTTDMQFSCNVSGENCS